MRRLRQIAEDGRARAPARRGPSRTARARKGRLPRAVGPRGPPLALRRRQRADPAPQPLLPGRGAPPDGPDPRLRARQQSAVPARAARPGWIWSATCSGLAPADPQHTLDGQRPPLPVEHDCAHGMPAGLSAPGPPRRRVQASHATAHGRDAALPVVEPHRADAGRRARGHEQPLAATSARARSGRARSALGRPGRGPVGSGCSAGRSRWPGRRSSPPGSPMPRRPSSCGRP